MKKIIESSKNLPAFSMNVKEFESFWQLLQNLLKNEKDQVAMSIDVKLKKEKIEFKSIEEFIAYKEFSDNLTDFHIYASSGEKRISIFTSNFINRIATIVVKSDEALWATVTCETIQAYLANHKVWYNWIVKLPLIRALATFIFIAMIVGFNVPKDYKFSHLIGYSLIGVYLTLLVLSGVRDKFLPGAKLIVINDEVFYKKYVTELTLGLALISVILAAIAIFK